MQRNYATPSFAWRHAELTVSYVAIVSVNASPTISKTKRRRRPANTSATRASFGAPIETISVA